MQARNSVHKVLQACKSNPQTEAPGERAILGGSLTKIHNYLGIPDARWATHLLKRQGEPSRDYCNFYVHKTCQQWQYNSHSPSQKNNSFLPLMVAIKYKILTGTGPQMVSPKHPILPWDVDGGHLPPKRGGLTPHDQGKVHLKCNRSTQGALGAYTHNALQEG